LGADVDGVGSVFNPHRNLAMNERIKELSIKAGFPEWSNHAIEFELGQFAELIVQECINIVRPTQHHEAFAQGYLGDVDGLELLDGKVKQIKQHFGVE